MILEDPSLQGILIAICIVSAWWLARKIYVWRETQKPLALNCLLTRKPVILVSGKSPLWKFWSLEQRSLRFLQNHGYESRLWQSKDLRAFPNLSEPLEFSQFHWILSSSVNASELPSFLSTAVRIEFENQDSLLNEVIRFAEEDFR